MQFPNQYDKVIIVCYPSGTGGNFLINCLGLDDGCVFSNADLADKQLLGQFGVQEKQAYLLQHLSQSLVCQKWQDLNLGNSQLFHSLQHVSIIDRLIEANKIFFYNCHWIEDIPMIKSRWPNANIIYFVEYQNFLNNRPGYGQGSRQHKLSEYWPKVKSHNSFNSPKNIWDFLQLPLAIQLELRKHLEVSRWFELAGQFNEFWHDRVNQLHQKNLQTSVLWHVDKNYHDAQSLVVAYDSICKKLNIKPGPDQIINWYFDVWRKTIKDMKNV